MKRIKLLLMAAVLCADLAACGQNSTPQTAVSSAAETQEPESIQEDREETESIQEDRAIPETALQDALDEEPSADPDDAADEASGVFSAFFDNHDVENNGSYFVRIGERVYYRLYSPDALQRVRLWGEGYLEEDDPQQPSDLMYYDLENGRTQKVCSVYGSGRLYAARDGFYLWSGTPDDPETILVNPGDGSAEMLGPGKPVSVSGDGHLLVTSLFRDTSYTYTIRRDGKETGSFGLAGDKAESTGVSYSVSGMAGDCVIAVRTDNRLHEVSLVSIDEKGKETILGDIPQPEAAFGTPWHNPEQLQFLADEKGVYLSVGYYEGTGHFLAGQVIVSAVPGKADSLAARWIEPEGEGEPDTVRIYLTGPGEYETAMNVPGEVDLSEKYYGDLVYYDSPYGAFRLKENFVPKPPAAGENEDAHIVIQDAAAIGDTAFVISAICWPEPEEDIGWREAYALSWLQYQAIPIQADGGRDAVKLGQLHSVSEEAASDGSASAGSAMDMLGAESPEELYRDVLEQTYSYLVSEEDADGIPVGIMEVKHYTGSQNPTDLVGYFFEDVNGGGIPELFVIEEFETGFRILAGYTVDGSDGEVSQFLDGWSRNLWRWLGGNRFLNSGSSGAMYSFYGIYSLPEDSAALKCEDYYFGDKRDGNPEKIAYYHNTSGISDVSISEKTAMTADSFWAYEDELTGQCDEMEIDYISFSEYGKHGGWGEDSHASDKCVLRVVWAEDVLSSLAEHEDITDSRTPITEKVVFFAGFPVYDFKLLSLEYKDYDTSAGKIIYDITEVYAEDMLVPDIPLVAPLSLAGTIPNNGFSYVDSSGLEHRFSINASGKDGSLVIERID